MQSRMVDHLYMTGFMVLVLLAGSGAVYAGDRLPYITTEGTAKGTDGLTIVLATIEKPGAKIPMDGDGVKFQVNDKTTAKELADAIAKNLNAGKAFNKYWEFSVKEGKTADGTIFFTIQGKRQKGTQGQAYETTITVEPKLTGLKIGGGVDPVIGTAHFDVCGDVSSSDRGSISIGIEGVTVSTSTFNAFGDKDILTIKLDLLDELISSGFTDAYIDPSTKLVTVPNVSTGDPIASEGRDNGAEFLTTDADIGGLARVTVSGEEASVEEDSVNSLLLCPVIVIPEMPENSGL